VKPFCYSAFYRRNFSEEETRTVSSKKLLQNLTTGEEDLELGEKSRFKNFKFYGFYFCSIECLMYGKCGKFTCCSIIEFFIPREICMDFFFVMCKLKWPFSWVLKMETPGNIAIPLKTFQ
jgi:hypothetical protein